MTEPELLRSAAAIFWAWVPPAALQGGIALLAAGLADRLLPRRAAPELREAAWGLAFAKLLLPPTLASPLALAPVLLPSLAAAAPAPFGADPARWAVPAAGIWGLGVVLFLSRAVAVARRGRRRLEGLRQEARGNDQEVLRSAASRLGLRRCPRLHRLPGGGSPFVHGVVRPAIYVPETVTDGELEHVLLHELAHVARRDGLRQGWARAIQGLFWFHPLLPWARRRLEAAAEAACDRRVARALGLGAPAYRSTLLAFYSRAAAAPVGVPFLAPPTALRLRLEAIAGAGKRPSTLRRVVATSLVAALAVALLPMAAAAERRSLEIAEWIVRPPGCLKLRYLVLQRLAQEAAEAAPAKQPRR